MVAIARPSYPDIPTKLSRDCITPGPTASTGRPRHGGGGTIETGGYPNPSLRDAPSTTLSRERDQPLVGIRILLSGQQLAEVQLSTVTRPGC